MVAETLFPKIQRKAHFFALILLIFGGFNYLALVFFNTTIVQKVVGYGAIGRLIYAAIGVAAVAVAFHRDTYLPFLGETVVPACDILAERIPEGADVRVKVRVPPGSKILYWAAEPSNAGAENLRDWRQAYANFKNIGITVADQRGHAYLKARSPGPYRVPFKGRLDPHIHYRTCQPNGLMGRVETVFISDAGEAMAADPMAPTISQIYSQPVEGFSPEAEYPILRS